MRQEKWSSFSEETWKPKDPRVEFDRERIEVLQDAIDEVDHILYGLVDPDSGVIDELAGNDRARVMSLIPRLSEALMHPSILSSAIDTLIALGTDLPSRDQHIVFDVFLEHRDALENELLVCGLSSASDVFKAAFHLASQKDPRYSSVGFQLLENHIEMLISQAIEGCHLEYMRFLFEKGRSSTIAIIESRLEKVLSRRVPPWALLGGMLCSSYDFKMLAAESLYPRIEKYGLPPEETLDAWMRSNYTHAFTLGETIRKNFAQIKILEKTEPGAVAFLNREFHIFDFARYPFDVLLTQYDERENTDLPYGIIYYPYDDHNGAFYAATKVFEKLFKDLKRQYLLRVAEGRSKIDLVKMLGKLDRKYGARHKISFAILGGHGTPHSIRLGDLAPYEESHELTIGDLRVEKKGRVRANQSRYFAEHPTLILISCSTGFRDGIGQEISNVFGATVIAPDVPTNIKNIRADIRGASPSFSVEYQQEKSVKVYAAGVPTPLRDNR